MKTIIFYENSIVNLGMVNCFVRVAKEEGTIALWRGNMGTFEKTLSGVTSKIKVGCVFHVVIVSLLPHLGFRRNDHREDATHFTGSNFFRNQLSHSMVLSNVSKLISSVIFQLKLFLFPAKTNIKAGLLIFYLPQAHDS